MQIGTVGLGRMGANMVRRLMKHGHETVVYDCSSEKVESLANFTGVVADSGEARGTIQAALEETVPVELLSAALYTRFRSRQPHTFAEKMLSAMRQKFGLSSRTSPGLGQHPSPSLMGNQSKIKLANLQSKLNCLIAYDY